MALGYATIGASCYKDPALLAAIKNSLEYAYNNYYGAQHLTDASYQKWVTSSNWWNWEIGIPLHLVDILMLVGEQLTQEQINKYLVPVDYFVPFVNYSACNRLWVGKIRFASSVLKNDTLTALLTLDEIYQVFEYVSDDDGFYTDGSFIQHNFHPYTGGYGTSLMEELTQFVLILDNTAFELPHEKIKNHYDWVFDAFEPIMWKSNLMSIVKGREISREGGSEYATFTQAFASLARMVQYAPEDIAPRLESLIKYFLVNNDDSLITKYIPPDVIAYLERLDRDRTVMPRADYVIFNVFGNMDKVVQHREDYAVAFSLSSDRIYKYEAINGDNQSGWYVGDGMVYIYTDGYDFDGDFFNNANPYKMPGTTVTAAIRTEENLDGGIFGSDDFVGGVEHGEYGVAAMILGYAQNDYFNTDITARKSYFAFDDEIVCLGSGISEGTTGKEVYTTVENRAWRYGDALRVNGQASAKGNAVINYAHFTNMGGYVFDGNTVVSYAKSGSYLEMTISHGVKPDNGKYFFIYLPNATSEDTADYYNKLSERITVISQTNTVHAVRDNDLDVTGYVFYEAGSCDGVTVSAACILMIDNDKISVSDPTHTLDTLTVTVDGVSYTFDLSDATGETFTAAR